LTGFDLSNLTVACLADIMWQMLNAYTKCKTWRHCKYSKNYSRQKRERNLEKTSIKIEQPSTGVLGSS